MLDQVLPPSVAWSEAFDHDATIDLFPAEAAAIERAVAKRRREFTAARACARRALAELGLPPTPIVPGLRGRPSWPDRIVGSMTHCADYCAAAVAWTHDLVTVGIDAEPNEPLPAGVLASIALPEEQAWIAAQDDPHTCWDRLLFCAKEAVYKAWFPLTERWLGFEEALIAVDPAAGTFTARIASTTTPLDLAKPDPIGFSGRWFAADGLIVAAIAVPTQ